jgi:hypothetical protein
LAALYATYGLIGVITLLLIPSDLAEPLGLEPFGRELRVERLTAEGLVAGHQGRGNELLDSLNKAI